MPFPSTPRVIYKKNPLKEVICQLRFPPILRIDKPPMDFQERVSEQFPDLTPSYDLIVPSAPVQVGQVPVEASGPALLETSFRIPRHPALFEVFPATSWSLESKELLNYTYSGPGDTYFTSSVTGDVLEKAQRFVKRLTDGDLERNAAEFLSNLKAALFREYVDGVDVSAFPMLDVTSPDDESILFEWAYDDCRLGFSIEPNPIESFWYIMTTPESGDVRASGLINCPNFGLWLRWLVSLVRLRS